MIYFFIFMVSTLCIAAYAGLGYAQRSSLARRELLKGALIAAPLLQVQKSVIIEVTPFNIEITKSRRALSFVVLGDFKLAFSKFSAEDELPQALRHALYSPKALKSYYNLKDSWDLLTLECRNEILTATFTTPRIEAAYIHAILRVLHAFCETLTQKPNTDKRVKQIPGPSGAPFGISARK